MNALHDRAGLERLFASFYRRGRAAHPRIIVTEEAFGRHLARCTRDLQDASIGDIAAEDLYLACACAVGARGAATAFERKFGAVIRRAIARVLKTPDERQEAEQRAWHRFFVEDGQGPPRITQYLGQGPLENWISVASMRIAVSFVRAESTEHRLRSKVIADTVGADPEKLSIQGQLRGPVEAAVAEAIDRLTPRERMTLKLHVVSGMTLEAIGKSLGVSRQAVSKTFARSRERILNDVKAGLKERLNLSKGDFSSVVRVVASQLDASISRVFGSE